MKGLKSADTQADWQYALPARFLHWMLAILIAGQVGVGWYMMANEDDPGSARYFQLHKSFGLVVLALVLMRLVWRATHRPAPLPAHMPKWETSLSHLTEWTLYAGMVLVPVVGVLGASYSKRGLAFFGMRLPTWTVPDHDTAEMFYGLHVTLAWVLVALVVLHVAGALKHLLIDKDGVFRRMWS